MTDNRLIDCWVVPEEYIKQWLGWIGTVTKMGIVIIPFGPRCKKMILEKHSKIIKAYPCGWYARFPLDYAFGVKTLGRD